MTHLASANLLMQKVCTILTKGKNMFDFHYTDINSRFGGSLGACHPKIYWVLLGGTLFESYP